jgi:site-specific DNA recombinase
VDRGLLYCGLCDRRMQGHWANEPPYYRCRYPEEYALANRVLHPRNVYLREVDIVPKLDKWLGRLFTPRNVDATIDILISAQGAVPPEQHEAVMLRRQLGECERNLSRHRAALEAGADPAVVAEWIKEEQAQKAAIEHRLRRMPVGRTRRLDGDQLAATLRDLGDMVKVLGRADPAHKAKIYGSLGLRLIYRPAQRKVLVTASGDQDHMGYQRCPRGVTAH